MSAELKSSSLLQSIFVSDWRVFPKFRQTKSFHQAPFQSFVCVYIASHLATAACRSQTLLDLLNIKLRIWEGLLKSTMALSFPESLLKLSIGQWTSFYSVTIANLSCIFFAIMFVTSIEDITGVGI